MHLRIIMRIVLLGLGTKGKSQKQENNKNILLASSGFSIFTIWFPLDKITIYSHVVHIFMFFLNIFMLNSSIL